MAKPITISSKTTGPFFELGARPIQEAARDLIDDLVKEGEAKVKAQLYPGHGYRTGEFSRSINGQVRSSLSGTIDDSAGGREAIIGKFLELGRYWPSTGHRFKGIHMFRTAAAHLRKIANEVAGKVYQRAIKRLT